VILVLPFRHYYGTRCPIFQTRQATAKMFFRSVPCAVPPCPKSTSVKLGKAGGKRDTTLQMEKVIAVFVEFCNFKITVYNFFGELWRVCKNPGIFDCLLVRKGRDFYGYSLDIRIFDFDNNFILLIILLYNKCRKFKMTNIFNNVFKPVLFSFYRIFFYNFNITYINLLERIFFRVRTEKTIFEFLQLYL